MAKPNNTGLSLCDLGGSARYIFLSLAQFITHSGASLENAEAVGGLNTEKRLSDRRDLCGHNAAFLGLSEPLFFSKIIAGKITRSPIKAVTMMMALNKPK